MTTLHLLGLGAGLLLAMCAARRAGGAGSGAVEVAPGVSVALSPPWKALPATTRDLVELSREEGGKETAHISVTPEVRDDQKDAVARLREIAEEREGPRTFTAICGWPALERRVRLKAARPLPGKPAAAGDVFVDVVTVAIAVQARVVRFEGNVPAGSPGADEILRLARSASCPKNPDPDGARKAIEGLNAAPR